MSKLSHILLIDPLDSMNVLLQAFLQQQGFIVETGNSLSALMDLYASAQPRPGRQRPNIVVVSGAAEEDIRQVRQHTDVALVVLMAPTDDASLRISLLEAGADEVLESGFNPRELLARCRAIGRRMQLHSNCKSSLSRFLCFGGYSLDTVARHLIDRAGDVIELSGSDYQLLLLLLQSSGEVVSRDSIAENTRGRGNLPMDRFIDVQMSRLRSRLGENARAASLIKTVRGKGYVMAATVVPSHQPVHQSHQSLHQGLHKSAILA